jgi:hypothetical protein
MSFRKYQKAESATVATPREHREINAVTQRIGKSSVREMTSDEKRALPQGDVDAR